MKVEASPETSPLDPGAALPYSFQRGEGPSMRALWSAVLVWSCAVSSFGCGSNSTDSTTPFSTSNGGMIANAGGVQGGGGLVGGGGMLANGGTFGSGGLAANGGVQTGTGGGQIGNGGFLGTGGIASGGFVGTGGDLGSGGLATGGTLGNGGMLPATGGSPGTGGATTLGPYPSGPFDDAVGSYLADLQLQGYLNQAAVGIANTKTFTNLYTMDDLRASGVRYALLHNSEFG